MFELEKLGNLSNEDPTGLKPHENFYLRRPPAKAGGNLKNRAFSA